MTALNGQKKKMKNLTVFKTVLAPNAPWPTKPIPVVMKKQGRQYGWRKIQIIEEYAKLDSYLKSEKSVNLSKLQAAKRYRDPVTGRFSNRED
jgi:hypothetical protein